MKTFSISASGIENIVLSINNADEEFTFIIRNKEISMNRIYADFISPRVSKMHNFDLTIDSFCFDDLIDRIEQAEDVFTPELVENFKLMSKGKAIQIDEKMAHQIKILSILLDNEEIFNQMNQMFPFESNKDKFDDYLQFIGFFDTQKSSFFKFDSNQIIDIISSNFFQIDGKKLLQLPIPILYSIISNKNLKVSNEDSLFDFINAIFKEEQKNENIIEKKCEIKQTLFYEKINVNELSENKFHELLQKIDSNEISRFLWEKLSKCMQMLYVKKTNISTEIKIEYDQNPNNRFKGIIYKLGEGDPKSLIDKEIIEITSSSVYDKSKIHQPRAAIDYENANYFHSSITDKDAWLCIDFKKRKIKLSQYSLKSNATVGKNWYNIQNWCIEGSNDKQNWIVLGERKNDKSLDDINAMNTFDINHNLENNTFFQFIRIRQTGVNSYSDGNDYRFIISSIEFFGTIINS